MFSNIFIIGELIHHSTKKDIKVYTVSIDQEKAFDTVDRDFLYKIMEKIGYSNTFISFIKKIYKNTQSVISNNDYLSAPFSLLTGVRQRCPLSPLLYIINSEVINLNIKSNEEIVGYPIPNQKEDLKLSQDVEDINCFALTEKSILETRNVFKTFELGTGATINVSKTMINPLADAKIYNLDKNIQNIQINNPEDFVKILGICFANDLQNNSNYNWELCISNLEKQVQQFSIRQLSLRGKTILLNTLILSKVTFQSNIFPIPTQILKQIEKIFLNIFGDFQTRNS